MQIWIVLALGSALFQGLRNVAMKRLGHALDETINVWGRFTFLLPFTGAAVLWRGVPPIQEGFWWLCLGFGISQNLATLCLSRALKHSDISLVTALWKTSLLFLVGWDILVLGEAPSGLGLAGIGLSMAGVYVLNISSNQVVWYAPLLALFKERGQLFTLGSAFFFAPSVIFIKQTALHSDPVFATFMGYVYASALITPFTIYRSGTHFRRIGRYWKDYFALGLFASISTILGTTAYTLTVSSYVEAVKQVEILFALALGYFLFHEQARVRTIWPGCLVMLAGLVMLKLWG